MTIMKRDGLILQCSRAHTGGFLRQHSTDGTVMLASGVSSLACRKLCWPKAPALTAQLRWMSRRPVSSDIAQRVKYRAGRYRTIFDDLRQSRTILDDTRRYRTVSSATRRWYYPISPASARILLCGIVQYRTVSSGNVQIINMAVIKTLFLHHQLRVRCWKWTMKKNVVSVRCQCTGNHRRRSCEGSRVRTLVKFC